MASRYSVPGTPEYHPDAMRWDSLEEHAALLRRLDEEFPDGWAYSLQSTALRQILPLAPEKTRVCAWVKPFATWKPGQWPPYAWEPVIIRETSRRMKKWARKVPDFVAAGVGSGRTAKFFGAKPPEFSRWLFDVFALGEHPDDVFVDLFPGSGAVSRAWDEFRGAPIKRADGEQGALFGGEA